MRVSDAPRATALPAPTLPVIDTIATSGCSTSAAPAVPPWPHTTLSTPGGRTSTSNSASLQRRVRRELRGLEHDGVARSQRRAELPGRHVEWVVPWRDRADDPDGIAPDIGRVALLVLAGGLAFQEPGGAGEEAPVVHGQVHLELDDRHRLADVLTLDARQLVDVGGDDIGDLVQHLAALTWRGRRPTGERGLGRRNGVGDVGGVAGGDLADGFTGGGVDDDVDRAARCLLPFPTDVVRVRHG